MSTENDNPQVMRWAQALVNRFRQIDGNMVMQLADKLGAKVFSLRNSDDAEVAQVNSLGDMNLGSRARFKTANADGGTYGVLGVDAGVEKNLELYDYFKGRPFLRLRSDLNSAEFFGPVAYPRVPYTRITSFQNSWVNAGVHNGYNQAGYYQDATGKVFLVGAISSGTAGAPSFTLPAGLRPSQSELFGCPSTGAGYVRLDIDNLGQVTVQTAGAGTIYLDGVSFYPSSFDSLFTAVTFQNSWVDFASGWLGCAYYKDFWGRVHLRGLMKSGTVGATAFTLPSGNRVWRGSIKATLANAAFGRLDYYSSGAVALVTGSNVYATISGTIIPTATEDQWLLPAQLGAWVDYDAVNFPPIQFWVDPSGRVHANGLAKSGTIGAGATGQAHSIPLPWSPHLNNVFAVASNDAYGRALVAAQGAYLSAEVGSNVWFSYGGVHWLPAF